jgi:hypothetical protein
MCALRVSFAARHEAAGDRSDLAVAKGSRAP